MGAMVPPSRKSCYNFRVTEINRVLDGDTIDVTIDLGFDLFKKERVRVAGVDTPEKRTRNLEEKALGVDATNWLKQKLEDTIAGDGDELTVRTELVGGTGKYGRLLGCVDFFVVHNKISLLHFKCICWFVVNSTYFNRCLLNLNCLSRTSLRCFFD